MNKTSSRIRDGLLESVLPSVVCFFIMALCIVPYRLIIPLDRTLTTPVVNVAGEETSPYLGRIYFLIYGLIMVLLGCLLLKILRKRSLKPTLPQFYITFAVGTILWQMIGEISWHFAFPTTGGYANFVRLESLQGLPLFILFVVFWADGWLNKIYGDNLLFVLGSFGTMWFGHVLTVGTAPIFSMVPEDTWLLVSAAVFSVPVLAVAVYRLFFRKTEPDKRERLFDAILLFAALGTLLYMFALNK